MQSAFRTIIKGKLSVTRVELVTGKCVSSAYSSKNPLSEGMIHSQENLYSQKSVVPSLNVQVCDSL